VTYLQFKGYETIPSDEPYMHGAAQAKPLLNGHAGSNGYMGNGQPASNGILGKGRVSEYSRRVSHSEDDLVKKEHKNAPEDDGYSPGLLLKTCVPVFGKPVYRVFAFPNVGLWC